jgi:putative ABC transport system substrate-binding protein
MSLGLGVIPMRRREFITLLSSAAAWPLAARAQPLSVPVIGFLDAATVADTIYRVSAFRDGLKEAGFIDGHNVAIEFRWAENKFDRLPALAADLVQRQVTVIVGPNTAMLAVRAATSTIPIVFVSGGDPIASTALQPKRLGLLHELVPSASTIAWLRDPRDPSFEGREKEVPPAARELGHQLLALNAQSAAEIDAAFVTIGESRAGALLIGNSILFNNRRRQLAALAARHGVPAIGVVREFVLAGGLGRVASDSKRTKFPSLFRAMSRFACFVSHRRHCGMSSGMHMPAKQKFHFAAWMAGYSLSSKMTGLVSTLNRHTAGPVSVTLACDKGFSCWTANCTLIAYPVMARRCRLGYR